MDVRDAIDEIVTEAYPSARACFAYVEHPVVEAHLAGDIGDVAFWVWLQDPI